MSYVIWSVMRDHGGDSWFLLELGLSLCAVSVLLLALIVLIWPGDQDRL